MKWPAMPVGGTSVIGIVRRIVRRGLRVLFEYPSIELMFNVRRALCRERDEYDLLVSIAVPHPIHWGVAWAVHQGGRAWATWVADCGDPFMGHTLDTLRKPFYFAHLKKWFCREADFIAVPIQEARDAYFAEFRDKIRVIPQGFSFEDIAVTRESVHNPVPTFAYAGGFISGRRDPTEYVTELVGSGL